MTKKDKVQAATLPYPGFDLSEIPTASLQQELWRRQNIIANTSTMELINHIVGRHPDNDKILVVSGSHVEITYFTDAIQESYRMESGPCTVLVAYDESST